MSKFIGLFKDEPAEQVAARLRLLRQTRVPGPDLQQFARTEFARQLFLHAHPQGALSRSEKA